MPSLSEIRRRVESFLASHPGAEVTEDGELLFDLRRSGCSLEETRGRLLLHLWSEERNWVRRVARIAEEGADRLVLEVEQFGRARPGQLVVASPSARTGAARDRQAARRSYSRFLRRLLERVFPGAEIEGVTSRASPKQFFSGLYTRARLREGRRWWAVLGVSEAEPAETADGILTHGLLWLDWNRRRFPERFWAGLRLMMPAGKEEGTARRLPFLDSQLGKFELYAVSRKENACTRVEPAGMENLETRITPAGQPPGIPPGESDAVERIRRLAPEAIEVVAAAGRDECALRFLGLEFARVSPGEIVFGLAGDEAVLRGDNFGELTKLVARMQRERVAGGRASDALYRWRAEAWLEQLVAAQPGRIDPRLLASPVYRQVVVGGGTAHGVADLLGATREGRLVLIELKASADIHLPLQALDYWMRVAWHHQRGEVAAAGYFPGVELQPANPEILLVAPALQIHPAAQTVAASLAPEVRMTLVGLNEDWRRERKVVWRQARRP